MHAARPTHRLRSKRPAICSRCLQPVGMGVVRVGSQLRVPCSGSGAARVSRVRGGGAALPSQATCAKINGGYVMWVARWCVSCSQPSSSARRRCRRGSLLSGQAQCMPARRPCAPPAGRKARRRSFCERVAPRKTGARLAFSLRLSRFAAKISNLAEVLPSVRALMSSALARRGPRHASSIRKTVSDFCA